MHAAPAHLVVLFSAMEVRMHPDVAQLAASHPQTCTFLSRTAVQAAIATGPVSGSPTAGRGGMLCLQGPVQATGRGSHAETDAHGLARPGTKSGPKAGPKAGLEAPGPEHA